MSNLDTIYVASSWRNLRQPEVVNVLRDDGYEVYDFRNPPTSSGFSWSEIDPNWQQWSAQDYVEALNHPRAVEGYLADFKGMEDAGAFVLVLPAGRSAHLELGWAAGKGKLTIILTEDGQEPELMAKMADYIATSIEDLRDYLRWLP